MNYSNEQLSSLRWRARRGLLENDLIIEKFLNRFEDQLSSQDIEALSKLLDLSDNDLLDLLLARKELNELPSHDGDPDVNRVLACLRTV